MEHLHVFLVGGKSERFNGENKAMLLVEDNYLIELVTKPYREAKDNILIIANYSLFPNDKILSELGEVVYIGDTNYSAESLRLGLELAEYSNTDYCITTHDCDVISNRIVGVTSLIKSGRNNYTYAVDGYYFAGSYYLGNVSILMKKLKENNKLNIPELLKELNKDTEDLSGFTLVKEFLPFNDPLEASVSKQLIKTIGTSIICFDIDGTLLNNLKDIDISYKQAGLLNTEKVLSGEHVVCDELLRLRKTEIYGRIMNDYVLSSEEEILQMIILNNYEEIYLYTKMSTGSLFIISKFIEQLLKDPRVHVLLGDKLIPFSIPIEILVGDSPMDEAFCNIQGVPYICWTW